MGTFSGSTFPLRHCGHRGLPRGRAPSHGSCQTVTRSHRLHSLSGHLSSRCIHVCPTRLQLHAVGRMPRSDRMDRPCLTFRDDLSSSESFSQKRYLPPVIILWPATYRSCSNVIPPRARVETDRLSLQVSNSGQLRATGLNSSPRHEAGWIPR